MDDLLLLCRRYHAVAYLEDKGFTYSILGGEHEACC